jgi:hypothetical protein
MARCADLTAATVTFTLAIISATDLTFTGSDSNKSPARLQSRRAHSNFDGHPQHEAMTNAQYAYGRGSVKPSA